MYARSQVKIRCCRIIPEANLKKKYSELPKKQITELKNENNRLSTISIIHIAKYKFKTEQTLTSKKIEVGSGA